MEEAHALALKKMIFALQPLAENEWESFLEGWQTVSYKRKTILTATGETEKYLYFVVDGVQRGFYANGEKEVTIVFSYPYSFSGIIDSFLLQQPSKYFLETLTSSTLLRAPYRHIEKQMESCLGIERYVRKSLSFIVSGILERQIELSCFSAEEKFRTLLKRSPHILQMIPHKYLASYLGLDPTTFSKLMATVRI
jgi:CRP-like cAMP-binding protein